MIKQFQLLLKIRLISQMRLNTLKGKKSIGDKMVIIGIILAFVIGVSYSTGLGYMLNEYNMRDHILAFSFLTTTLIILMMSFFKASDELFGSRDNETLMSFPIKTSVIVMSRFFFIYFWNTVIALIIMLPMGAVYFFTGTVSGVFWLKLLIGILTVALIPSIVASIISILILEISSRTKHSRMVSSIFYVCILLLFLIVPKFSTDELAQDDISLMLTNLLNKMNQVYPMIDLYDKALTTGEIGAFLLYIVISVLLTAIFIIGLSFIYKGLHTRISSISSKKKYEVKTLKRSSILKALYLKEMKRLFSSTTYLMNKAIGMVFMIIYTISLALGGVDSITKLLGDISLEGIDIVEVILKLTPYIMAMFICLSCTSSVSFSLEGKNVWIIKTLPLSKELVVRSKMLANLTITVPLTILNGIVIGLVSKVTLFEFIILLILPCVVAVFSAIYGIAINLKFVNYDWESEVQVVKQSVASLLGMFGSIIVVFVTAIPRVMCSNSIAVIYDIAIIACLSIVTCVLYAKTIKGNV